MQRTEPDVRRVRWTVGIIMISGCCAYLWALSTWRSETPQPDQRASTQSPEKETAPRPADSINSPASRELLAEASSNPNDTPDSTGTDPVDIETASLPLLVPPKIDHEIAPVHPSILSDSATPLPQEDVDTEPAIAATPESQYQQTLEINDFWEKLAQNGAASQDNPSQPVRLIRWPTPHALILHLESMTQIPELAPWAHDVLTSLETLSTFAMLTGEEPEQVMEHLVELVEQSDVLLQDLSSPDLNHALGRARYCLSRRLALWSDVLHALPVHNRDESGEVATAISNADGLLREAAGWREFMLIDELIHLAQQEESAPLVDLRRATAQRLLARLKQENLSLDQYEYLQQPEIVALSHALQHWTADPNEPAVNLLSLLCDLEEYETSNSLEVAKRILATQALLASSPHPELRRIANHIDYHYRNANIRTSMSSEFINRFMPDPDQVEAPVRDYIFGARVTGQSAATTQLRIKLVPDNSRARLQLEASGNVLSQTRANRGPVAFYNDGQANYHAEKLLLFDPTGMRVWQAQANANSSERIRSIRTDYDSIPLLGNVVRNIARNQYNDQKHQFRQEVENRVSSQAARRFDDETRGHIASAYERLQEDVVSPLDALQLDPTAVEMRTTEDELIMRWRIASDDQLAAHTARPKPPLHSLFAIQLHESALNNMVKQLGLDGCKGELRDIYATLAERLGHEDPVIPEDMPHGVIVQFAEEDSVRVSCDEGRLMLSLNIARLEAGRNHWENFRVQAYYTPIIEDLHGRLGRQSSIELIGQDLRLRDQIALRGIFTKALSRNNTLDIIHPDLAEREELADQAITQFIIRNGWIGVALGHGSSGPDASPIRQAVSLQ